MLNFEKSLFSKVTLSYSKKQIRTVKSFIVHATVQHLVKSHNVKIASPYGSKQITIVKSFKTYKVDTTMLKFEKNLF